MKPHTPPGSLAYDPILGFVEGGARRDLVTGGYATWPEGASRAAREFRILAIGNEATAWPDQAWSRNLARSLQTTDRHTSIRVYNGSGYGSGSPQELLRLLRDAPAIRPNLVLTLSGAADAVLGWKVRPYPFRLGKPAVVEDMVQRLKLARQTNFGFPETRSAATIWCRNQRLSVRVARELGSHILTFLQPVESLDAFDPSGTRDDFLRELGLEADDRSRALEEIEAFYDEVRSIVAEDPETYGHVIDLSHLFAERQDAFTHAWTLDADGVVNLSRAMEETVRARWSEMSSPVDDRGNDEPAHRRNGRSDGTGGRAARILFCRTSGVARKSGLAATLQSDARLETVLPESVGPSNIVSLPWDLRDVDFRDHDVCVIECSATEEVLVHQGRLSVDMVLDPILEVVGAAGRAGCRVMVIVEPSQRRFDAERPLAARLGSELRRIGVAVLDLYALLERVSERFDLGSDRFFAGPLHLKPAVAESISRFVTEQLVAIAGSPPSETPAEGVAKVRPSRFVGASVGAPASETVKGKRQQLPPVLELEDGATVTVKATDAESLQGLVLAPHHSAGRLATLDGKEVWRHDGQPLPVERRRYFLQTIPVPPAQCGARTLRFDAGGSEINRITIAGFIVRSASEFLDLLVAPVDGDYIAIDRRAGDKTLRRIASASIERIARNCGIPGMGTGTEPSEVSFLDAPGRSGSPGRDGDERGQGPWAYLRKAVGDYVSDKPFASALRRKAEGGEKEVSDGTSPTVGVFDPLLGQINAKASHPHFKGGYKIWPSVPDAAKSKFRIMAIGNSTSLWPSYPWSLFLGENLAGAGYSVSIYNGAGKGHSSSQEVIRVIRDAPALKPHLIVALSGICDIGYLVNAKGYPFLHKYSRELTELVKTSGFAATTSAGYPDPAGPAEVWCRNQRFARVLSAELNINYLTLLQPVMGYGKYERSPEEDKMFRQKAGVVLKSFDRPYGEAVKSFYDDVFQRMTAEPERYAHVVSLVDVFDGCTDVYKDHRHLTENGCRIIASAIEKIVLERFGRQLARTRVEPVAAPAQSA